MAKTEYEIKGRVGNIVFYQVGAETRVRSTPVQFKDPNTTKQQLIRKRFIGAVRFYQRMQEDQLATIWKFATRKMPMNGYNLFMKQNIHVFNDHTLHDPANLMLTIGELPPMNHLEVARQVGNKVTLVWENSLNMEGVRANDRLQVVALFENRMFTPVRIPGIKAFRRDRTVTVDLDEQEKQNVHLYCFFVSPDYHAYSPSYYISTILNPNK